MSLWRKATTYVWRHLLIYFHCASEIKIIWIWYENLSEELPPLLWTNHSSCTVHHPRLEMSNHSEFFTISPEELSSELPPNGSQLKQSDNFSKLVVYQAICHHYTDWDMRGTATFNWEPAWNSNRRFVPWKRLQFKQTLSFPLIVNTDDQLNQVQFGFF